MRKSRVWRLQQTQQHQAIFYSSGGYTRTSRLLNAAQPLNFIFVIYKWCEMRKAETACGTYREAVGKVGSVISALYSAEKRENSQCWKWVKGQMHCSTAAHTHCNHRDVCCVCATGSDTAKITCSFTRQLLFQACFFNYILLQLSCGHTTLFPRPTILHSI